jgi:hypothetical protein
MMLLKLQSARSRGFRAPPSRLLVCFYSRTAQRPQLCPASDLAVLRPTRRGGTWWFARVGFPTIVCLLRLTPFLHSLVCSGCCCSVVASVLRSGHGLSPVQQPLVSTCCFCDVCRQYVGLKILVVKLVKLQQWIFEALKLFKEFKVRPASPALSHFLFFYMSKMSLICSVQVSENRAAWLKLQGLSAGN